MREYLTSSYLSYTPDPSLISDVQTKLTNVFFNATATRALLGGSPNLTAFHLSEKSECSGCWL